MNSYQYDSHRYDILCLYHVNEYRATSGNQDELVPEWNSSQYHVNTPLECKLSQPESMMEYSKSINQI